MYPNFFFLFFFFFGFSVDPFFPRMGLQEFTFMKSFPLQQFHSQESCRVPETGVVA